MTLRFTGPLAEERLTEAVAAVAARHDVLFTVFDEAGGEPRQRLLDDRVLRCPIVDLTGAAPAGPRTRAEELVAAEARHPEDLLAGESHTGAVRALVHDAEFQEARRDGGGKCPVDRTRVHDRCLAAGFGRYDAAEQ